MNKPEKKRKKASSYEVGGTIAVVLVPSIVLLISAVILIQGGTVTFSVGIIGLLIMMGIVYFLGGVIGFVVHLCWMAVVILLRTAASFLRGFL